MDLNLIKQIRMLGSSVSVLYAEDEANIREQVSRMLKQLFDTVDVAENGQDALEKYKNKKYDLVITDLKMPYMDGVELCENIMLINKEQSILLISAHKEPEELLRLIDIGVSGFLLKPIKIDAMHEKLYLLTKDIYSNKMMKHYYDDMKKQLSKTYVHTEDDINNLDAPTMLYNHKYFVDLTNDSEFERWAILININDFKLINNYYSFVHGNHLLHQIADILKKETLELGYEIFKVSNNEFVMLKKDVPLDCSVLSHDANNIINVLEKTKFNLIGMNDININVTLGIAKSKHKLLECLINTLDYAKEKGVKYAFFRDVPDGAKNLKNIIEIKNMLQESIANDLIVPFYQPIVTFNKKIKYEVLMRIKTLGTNDFIEPSVFLDIAKKYNYYNEISQMVIFKAIEDMLTHNRVFSINFSYPDMNNDYLMNKLEKLILENELGSRLIFEIVETEHLDSMLIVEKFIERFRFLGVKFAIDDFGSGYSNFSYIFSLRPDFVKIDGSLIVDMLSDEKMFMLINTIIDFAHKLNIEVIAEHVSSSELHDALTKLNVDAMQGYFIGHPSEYIETIGEINGR